MSNYDLFESYIFQKLSAEQVQEFENRLSSDNDFKENYENHLQMQSALDVLIEDDIVKVIDKIKDKETQTDLSDNENIKSIIPKRWMIIAAAFLFLIATSIILKDKLTLKKDLVQVESPQIASVYPEYFEPKTKSRGDNDIKGESTDMYETYGKDINALIKSEKYPEAVILLKALMAAFPNTTDYDQAEWNLAFAYAQFDKTQALEIIEKILTDPLHTYNDQAKVKKLKASLQ